MLTLREYQNTIIEQASGAMRQGSRAVLIQAPTGSGKTALIAHMLGTAASKGITSFFIVHRRELVKQAIKAFHTEGLKYGVIAAGFPQDRRQPIQIASVQTLANQYSKFKVPGMICFDEAHHCAAKSWAKVYAAFPDAYKIGLTATPLRLDGSGLDKYFKSLVIGPTVPDLIQQGFLASFRLYVPAGGIDTAGLHTRMGDFITAEVAARADKPTITGNAIKEYRKYADGKRAVVFCASIEHSKHVVGEFIAAGIPAAHVDGETDVKERDQAIADFEAGKIKILSNVELFGEGFDLPAIECAILLRPTQSLGLYLQQVGRALRPSPGKDTAIILDHAGNCERHGLPNQIREWSLAGRTPAERRADAERVIGVRVCPHCFAATEGFRTACPFCGHVFAVKAREVKEVEGDLVEYKEMLARKAKKDEERGAATVEELTKLGVQRGYKYPRMWAENYHAARERLRAKYGRVAA